MNTSTLKLTGKEMSQHILCVLLVLNSLQNGDKFTAEHLKLCCSLIAQFLINK